MHQQCYLCVHCPKKWATPMNGKREGLRRWLQMENIRCRSENHVPISAVLKNFVYPMSLRRRWVTDCKSEMPDHQDRTREDLKSDVPREENSGQASGDRLHVPGVQGSRRPVTSRKFQNGFNLSKKASLVTFPDSHNVTRRPCLSTAKTMVMPQRRIIKFSLKRTNLVCSIVTQLWCGTLVLLDPMQLNNKSKMRKIR